MKIKSSKKTRIRPFQIIVGFLVLLLIVLGYYRTKVNEMFGLKRFTSFTHPYCMEPFVNLPSELDRNQLGDAWDAGVDREVGIELHYPADWKSQDGCREHYCLQSSEFDGTHGQVIRISRIDKRLGFPYEHFFYSRPTTDILKYLLGQLNCSYIRIGGLNGIRQIDRTNTYTRVVYALDARDAAYIVVTENYGDADEDKKLESIVANFRAIPVEPKYVGDISPYSGAYSTRIPYKNITFDEHDIYEERQISKSFFPSKILGITFVAYKGDLINMELIVPGTINVMPDVSFELYSYGPTVLRGEGRFEWRVPVTGRYFLVLKDGSSTPNRSYWLRTRISP